MNIIIDGSRASLKTSNGCSNVSGVPLAEFGADSINIIFGGSVNFSDLSAGIPTTWNWTLTGGSPSSSNVQNPTVTYNTPGSYAVKLIVSNAHGSDTLEKTGYIRVNGAPMSVISLLEPPNITSVNTNPSDTSTIQFKWTSAGSDPSINYKWKIKKGGTSNEKIYLSNNSGVDTVFTIRYGLLDSIAQDFGTTGDSVICTWSAWSFNGVDSASSNIFIVILKRTNVGITQLSSTIPDKFKLENNYPNPFNPTTKIVFEIPKSVNVELRIYDAIGREIETLVNNKLQPGRYEYTWGAHTLSSGLYFYRLKANGFVQTKRMVLIK
jgi:PKD repeat protein